MSDTLDRRIEHLLRELAPQVLAAVARRYPDFSAAEDAVQEALIAAVSQWTPETIPDNPRGWLYHVAMRRLTDQVRSEVSRRRREETVAGEVWASWAFVPPPDVKVGVERDDTLLLLAMCCHPSLTPASAVALTLRAVGGLTTAEIASAFLVPEATMAQRISRAKATIKSSDVQFETPSDAELTDRLPSVLHTLYLIFTEGYASSSGHVLARTDLSNEAIRLTRALREIRPADTEIAGLLALMLLTDARRDARTDANGSLVPLDEQDRSLWNQSLIEEGRALLAEVLPLGRVGPFQLQAAIAAVHDEAARVEDTDWPQILALYTALESFGDNPMVTLNRAIAVSMVDGADAALAMIDALEQDPRMKGHHRLDAIRGHLHARLGDTGRAIENFTRASEKTMSIPERDYLLKKIAQLQNQRGQIP